MSRAKTHRSLWSIQQHAAPYAFVAPFVILFIVFQLYPLARSLVLSTHKTIGPQHQIAAGLDNYRFVLRDRYFWLAVANTVVYTLSFVALQIPMSFALAMLLNSRRVWGRAVYRFAFFSTNLIGPVFVAVLFAQLFDTRSGLINLALSRILQRPVEIAWLGDPKLALASVLIAGLWLSVGFGMIYFLAALQAVDHHLYESAQVDGAGRWSKFWHITLPSVRPALIFVLLLDTISGFQLFELPWVLFRQTPGPNSRALTVVMYLFQVGFQANDLGVASAVGWILVAMILLVAIAQLRIAGSAQELPH